MQARVTEVAGVPEELEKAIAYLPRDKLALVGGAYQFAEQVHRGQSRLSGEPFVVHPLQASLILAELRLDADTLAAALLHDAIEDAGVTLSELSERFGPKIASLVDGVTKLTRATPTPYGSLDSPEATPPPPRRTPIEAQAEALRKMLVAMAEDIRVVLIKLADRLHNMRTVMALPLGRRRQFALETLEIYAPLAHRLGIWEFKWQLEDLAFRVLEPGKYREVSRLVVAGREAREAYLARAVAALGDEFRRAGLKVEITSRPKHLYSVSQKIQKYAEQGKDFGQIYDLLAVRVLVDSVAECYTALGIVHSLWHPLPGQFNDYIANSKDNGYQSLHTTVMALDATPLEIQIRTRAMHHLSEFGVAAHWRYKEGSKPDLRFDQKMNWLRQIIDWQRSLSGPEFLESVKTDVFRDQVFVYTPKGDIKEMPAGSTPIDFAFRVHTELGYRCAGAKVNGRLVPLNYRLQNGETVEIMATKVERGPSRDWLNPDLGYVATSTARQRIRGWFRRQERGESIQRGRELLVKELKRLGIVVELEQVAALVGMPLDDLLANLGYGETTLQQVVAKLAAQEERPRVAPSSGAAGPASGVQILGVSDPLMRVAQCCHPVPGDDIVGFITRSRGVSVHRRNCHNIMHEDEPQRIIPVAWGHTARLYPVDIEIMAWDRVGLLRDITSVISAEKINIASLNSGEPRDGVYATTITVDISGIEQLSRLLSKLEGVKGVIHVARNGQAHSHVASQQAT
ncbi:MAG: bifunctional (p)ppGpp synthetase/guanosine-3',5'-bis(diphosphate) 3'-pyrophosphohydrolase [Chloroflexi bacterium]|nr:bifunctional (p)ppGpp synthetase/guanosine-3',5'-bis(diphosphate) 3'-pyrophosphohydrolase [Chloroflexota bacterium]